MPISTKNYGLIAFTDGDSYSASQDRRRFSIIDNQMSFLAEQIGDGIIDGWNITVLNSNTVQISPGTALIDGFFVKTYGNLTVSIPINQTIYLYMQRLSGIISQVSAFAPIVSIPYSDDTPPAIPATPIVTSVAYNSIQLSWPSNTEPDLSGYNIYRTNETVSTVSGIIENYSDIEFPDLSISTPITASSFFIFSPPVGITHPLAATPVLGDFVNDAGPGQSTFSLGANFSTLSGENFGSDTRFIVFSQTTSSNAVMVDAQIQYLTSDRCILTIPDSIASGYYCLLWGVNSIGAGTPVLLNGPELRWVGCDMAIAGETSSCFGVNLIAGDILPGVYIAPTSSESSGVWATVTKSESYRIQFTVPSLAPGGYNVWIYVGGGKYGWSGPVPMTIIAADAGGGFATVASSSNNGVGGWIDVTKSPYDADPTGVSNSYSGILAAAEACPQFGTLYFPAGIYQLTYEAGSGNEFNPGYGFGFGFAQNSLYWLGAGINTTTLNCNGPLPTWINNGQGGFKNMKLVGTGFSTIYSSANGNYVGFPTVQIRTFFDTIEIDIQPNSSAGVAISLPFNTSYTIIRNCIFRAWGIAGDGMGRQIFIYNNTFYGRYNGQTVFHPSKGSEMLIDNNTVQEDSPPNTYSVLPSYSVNASNPNYQVGGFVACGRHYGRLIDTWGVGSIHDVAVCNNTITGFGDTTLGSVANSTTVFSFNNAGECLLWETDDGSFCASPTSTTATTITFPIAIAWQSNPATSTSSLTLGTGTKTLTIQEGLSYTVNQIVVISNSVSNRMSGTVTSYTSGTEVLVINSTASIGSGTFSSWTITTGSPPPTVTTTGSYSFGYSVGIISGTGAGQVRTISAWNATTNTLTVDTAFCIIPDATSVIVLGPGITNQVVWNNTLIGQKYLTDYVATSGAPYGEGNNAAVGFEFSAIISRFTIDNLNVSYSWGGFKLSTSGFANAPNVCFGMVLKNSNFTYVNYSAVASGDNSTGPEIYGMIIRNNTIANSPNDGGLNVNENNHGDISAAGAGIAISGGGDTLIIENNSITSVLPIVRKKGGDLESTESCPFNCIMLFNNEFIKGTYLADTISSVPWLDRLEGGYIIPSSLTRPSAIGVTVNDTTSNFMYIGNTYTNLVSNYNNSPQARLLVHLRHFDELFSSLMPTFDISITNAGGQAGTFTLASNKNWLEVPSSINVTAENTETFAVIINTALIEPGDYTASITVSGSEVIGFNITFLNPAVFVEIEQTSTPNFTDISVVQDSTYSYKITAIDVNGNESSPSNIIETSSAIDERVPGDPVGVQVFDGNETLQVYWDAGIYLIDHYLVTLVPISTIGNSIGATIAVSVPVNTFYYIFTDLDNGQLYQITVQSVSITGVTSPGIIIKGTPYYTGNATEITNIQANAIVTNSTTYTVALEVTWDIQINEYFPPPNYYLITVTSGNQTGIPSIYIDQNVVITSYTIVIGGTNVPQQLYQNTSYTILIQTVTEDIVSSGFIYRITTPIFQPPAPITDLSITTNYSTTSRLFQSTWQNSTSNFDYNEITLTRTSLTDNTVQYIYNTVNFGQATLLTLPPADVLNNSSYVINVTPIDSFGNVGMTTSATAVISQQIATVTIGSTVIADAGDRPPVPAQQFGQNGDAEATIYWNAANSPIIASYKIYRTVYSDSYVPSNFQLVAQVPSTIFKFNDYSVVDGTNYAYFVTSVDVFGNESLNPSDNYISYPLIIVEPHSYLPLTPPNVISIQKSGYDAILTWIPTQDSFDGHEIYRSANNLYSFEFVGSTPSDVGTFIDVNGLLQDGNYYYTLRKFINEASVITTQTSLPSAGTLPIGVVSNPPSGLAINSTSRFVIQSLLGPIVQNVSEQLNNPPVYIYYGPQEDLRIRLENNLYIPAVAWTTTDFITYTASVTLPSNNNYVAYINGVQSPYNTVIDVTAGTITFDQAIYPPTASVSASSSTSSGTSSTSSASSISSSSSGISSTSSSTSSSSSGITAAVVPEVSVIFMNVGETTGILPTANMENIIAERVINGIFDIERIPQLSHYGRYRETLIAQSSATTQENVYLYSIPIPSGSTFYDVLTTPDNLLLAATSYGVRITGDSSSGWIVLFAPNNPVTKVLYSSYLQMYFAVTGNQVYYSTNRADWILIGGMSGAYIARDIVDSGNGTIYVSTDAGVYYCQPLEFIAIFWTQLPPFDSLDLNTYGMAYSNNELFVSGGSGIFKTSNSGINWTQVSGPELQVPCYSIYIQNNYIFAVSNNRVWRQTNNEAFADIGDFDIPCRKGIMFAGQFYITTDQGLYQSSSDNNILSDSDITWVIAFQNTIRNTIFPVTYSLNVFNGQLWMGLDEQLYAVSPQLSLQLYSDESMQVVSPTVYANKVARSVGVYYSLNGFILFDTALQNTDIVTVTTSYNQFTSSGGWVETKFDATVIITINGIDLVGPNTTQEINGLFWTFPPAPFQCSSAPSYVAASLNQIQTPFFNARTADFNNAQASLTLVVQQINSIVTLSDQGATSVPSSLVASVFTQLDLFKSYISPSLRQFVTYAPLTGTFTVNGYTVIFDVISGNITIQGLVTKYTLCQLSVEGVQIINTGVLTHTELENAFDQLNSGLTTPLSFVQQSNIVKAGIYLQQTNPYDQQNRLLQYQSVYNSVCDSGWYDKLLSTIDYTQMIDYKPSTQIVGTTSSTGFSIEYPSDVLYLPNNSEVWICGAGGIISVNTINYSVTEVFVSEFYVYNMSFSGGLVYAIAEDGIYTIDPSSDIATKLADLSLPQLSKSIYVSNGTIYLAAFDGIYSMPSYGFQWQKLFGLLNGHFKSTTNIVAAIGTDPTTSSNSLVFYSYGGAIWNESSFNNVEIYSIAQVYNSVYYATNNGLIVEDLTSLYQETNFSGPTISYVNLSVSSSSSGGSVDIVNDVDANVSLSAAGTANGYWYSLNGSSITGSGLSSLGTIHKIRIIDGQIWLFANDLIEIVGVPTLIQLSTGRALS